MSPSLVLSLYGGVIADRTDRRRLLLITQTILMLCAVALAILTALGSVALAHILAISLVSGVALALTTPVYQTILHELVPAAHLMNAITLNSVQFNLARILGPLGMAVVTPLIGIAGCFLVNAASFFAMLAAVRSLNLSSHSGVGARSVWNDLRTGVRYAWRAPLTRTSLALTGALSLFGFPYMALLPAFARDVLALDADHYGLLVAAPGCGAVLGGLALAAFGNVRRKGLLAAIGAVCFSVALIGFALSEDTRHAASYLFVVGMSMVGVVSTINTVLQLTTDAALRGRVMSMLALALFGLAPVGSLHLGIWAHYVGTARALAGGGGVCLIVAVWTLGWSREMRKPVDPIAHTTG